MNFLDNVRDAVLDFGDVESDKKLLRIIDAQLNAAANYTNWETESYYDQQKKRQNLPEQYKKYKNLKSLATPEQISRIESNFAKWSHDSDVFYMNQPEPPLSKKLLLIMKYHHANKDWRSLLDILKNTNQISDEKYDQIIQSYGGDGTTTTSTGTTQMTNDEKWASITNKTLKLAFIKKLHEAGSADWKMYLNDMLARKEISQELYEHVINLYEGTGTTGTGTTGTTGTTETTETTGTGTTGTPATSSTTTTVNVTVPGDGRAAGAAAPETKPKETINILGNEIPKDYVIYVGVGGLLVYLWMNGK